jgi:hypothetical protein
MYNICLFSLSVYFSGDIFPFVIIDSPSPMLVVPGNIVKRKSSSLIYFLIFFRIFVSHLSDSPLCMLCRNVVVLQTSHRDKRNRIFPGNGWNNHASQLLMMFSYVYYNRIVVVIQEIISFSFLLNCLIFILFNNKGQNYLNNKMRERRRSAGRGHRIQLCLEMGKGEKISLPRGQTLGRALRRKTKECY